MIIGALGVLISISWFGILTFILFLIGAVIILTQKGKQTPTLQTLTPQP
jgi:hypothetical protein